MLRDWNSNVNQTKTASFSVVNSMDERFHRPIMFKIIVRHLNVEEVQIPPQFLEYVSDVPFHVAILKGPSGCYWHVEICRAARGVFLRDGWQEFQRDNSIRHHDLLIFSYIGNWFFEIEVFDDNGLEKINLTRSTNTCEAEPSSKERKGSTPRKPPEAAPSGVKRKGRPPKNNVGRNLSSAAQIIDRSGLGGIGPERIANNCEAALSKERIANNREAESASKKRNRPQIHLGTTPSGAKRRGRPSKHLEASSFGKDKSGTELQRDDVHPSTLEASKGTDCRVHLKASSHDEKRNGRCPNDNMHQLNLNDYVPGTCPQIHLGTTHSGPKRRGRPPKQLKASSYGEDKSRTKLQREDVGPFTLQGSEGTDGKEYLKASSHDEKRSGRTQNDDNVRVNMQVLKLNDYVPGTCPPINLETAPSCTKSRGIPPKHLEASSSSKDKCRTKLQREDIDPLTLQESEGTDCREHLKGCSHDEKRNGRTQNDDDVRVDMHQLNFNDYSPGTCPQIHLEKTPSCAKRRGRPPKHLEASSFGEDKSGTELQREDIGPLTLQPSEGTDFREHFKASWRDEKRSGRTQNDDNVFLEMHQLDLCGYVPDETGGMLPSHNSNYKDGMNRERTSGCRMRSEKCLLEGVMGTGVQYLDGSDKEQCTQKKKKQNEADKRAFLPTIQIPSEKDIERAWRKSELLVLKGPYYKCYLESFNLQKFILPIQKSFAQEYFPDNKTTVILRNLQGQDWTVNVVPTKAGHSFAGGWRGFALENKLKVGDVCVFELVQSGIIQVHVLPCAGEEVDPESSGTD